MPVYSRYRLQWYREFYRCINCELAQVTILIYDYKPTKNKRRFFTQTLLKHMLHSFKQQKKYLTAIALFLACLVLYSACAPKITNTEGANGNSTPVEAR